MLNENFYTRENFNKSGAELIQQAIMGDDEILQALSDWSALEAMPVEVAQIIVKEIELLNESSNHISGDVSLAKELEQALKKEPKDEVFSSDFWKQVRHDLEDVSLASESTARKPLSEETQQRSHLLEGMAYTILMRHELDDDHHNYLKARNALMEASKEKESKIGLLCQQHLHYLTLLIAQQIEWDAKEQSVRGVERVAAQSEEKLYKLAIAKDSEMNIEALFSGMTDQGRAIYLLEVYQAYKNHALASEVLVLCTAVNDRMKACAKEGRPIPYAYVEKRLAEMQGDHSRNSIQGSEVFDMMSIDPTLDKAEQITQRMARLHRHQVKGMGGVTSAGNATPLREIMEQQIMLRAQLAPNNAEVGAVPG